jgi:quercetin dioxygenase-like cupin family protein
MIVKTRLLTVVLALLAAGVATWSSAAAQTGTPTPVTRTVYGEAEPENAPGQSLTLQRVVIEPGAELPEHFHEGTQLATIRSGVLTYNVVSGAVSVTRRDGTTEVVKGPDVVKLRKGDTIVEPESLVHYGGNDGTKKVVIELAALLNDGAELSTPIGTGATGVTTVRLNATLSSQARTLYQVGPDNVSTYGSNRLTGTASSDGQPVGIEMLATLAYESGNGPFSGVITFAFADGSTIGVSMVGSTTAAANGTDASFASTLGVIGGSGRYVNSRGYGTFTGTRNAALGTDVAAEFTLQLR